MGVEPVINREGVREDEVWVELAHGRVPSVKVRPERVAHSPGIQAVALTPMDRAAAQPRDTLQSMDQGFCSGRAAQGRHLDRAAERPPRQAQRRSGRGHETQRDVGRHRKVLPLEFAEDVEQRFNRVDKPIIDREEDLDGLPAVAVVSLVIVEGSDLEACPPSPPTAHRDARCSRAARWRPAHRQAP